LYSTDRFYYELCAMKSRRIRKMQLACLLMALVFPAVNSCKKEEKSPEIPYVAVNIVLNPNSTEYINLNPVNGWETIIGGYNGILVFRKAVNEFAAFERACPYDPITEGAQVRVDDSGITCHCPVCGSKYIMVDGTPYEGPSRYSLKQYTTVYDGGLLYITN
jgi:nitrite reductase/ring-hydroxylating ferredoxin subunit